MSRVRLFFLGCIVVSQVAVFALDDRSEAVAAPLPAPTKSMDAAADELLAKMYARIERQMSSDASLKDAGDAGSTNETESDAKQVAVKHGLDGINSLLAVTAAKAAAANQEALDAAAKQRDLVKQQQDLRAAQRKLEEMVHADAGSADAGDGGLRLVVLPYDQLLRKQTVTGAALQQLRALQTKLRR